MRPGRLDRKIEIPLPNEQVQYPQAALMCTTCEQCTMVWKQQPWCLLERRAAQCISSVLNTSAWFRLRTLTT
jgi:ATP-dependent 26S proteasome regulatory subunit